MTKTNGFPLPRDDREWLLGFVDESGLAEVARRLGLSRAAVASAAAGFACYRRTHVLVRLARLAD